MRSSLQRLLETARPGGSNDATALQLRLLMAMAYVDGRLGETELEQLVDFVDRSARNRREHDRLIALVDDLAARPPQLEQVLEELVRFTDQPALGGRIVHELAELAGADGVDHRESFLLDLVCDALGMGPVDMHDAGEEIAAPMHRLAHDMARSARWAA